LIVKNSGNFKSMVELGVILILAGKAVAGFGLLFFGIQFLERFARAIEKMLPGREEERAPL